MVSIKDFMIKEDKVKELIAPKTLSLQDCISTVNPILTNEIWVQIIDGIASGSIKGYQDLMHSFGIDLASSMSIWENGALIKKISRVLVNQAKNTLLTSGVKKLENIFEGNGDTDQAISAIDKLAKIVSATEEKKDVSNNVNIQFNLESILRSSNNKGVIDV